MPTVSDVIRRGTRAEQPAANTVSHGTLFYVVDESVTERSNGTAWESYSSTAAGVPAHHATHDTGGTDAITALSTVVLTSGTLSDARFPAVVPATAIRSALMPPAVLEDGQWWVECTGTSPTRVCAIKVRDGGVTRTIASLTY